MRLSGKTTKCCIVFSINMLFAISVRGAEKSTPFSTSRPEKAVVIGGSISRFYAGNFGQFLQFGCPNLEVVNRGQVGAGAARMLQNFREGVLAPDGLLAHMPADHRWLIVQGGLNSVWLPQATSRSLSRLFVDAHDAGIAVVALSLTPWGDGADSRFVGWKALRLHQATAHVVDFVMGRLSPAQAFGARSGRSQPASLDWLSGQLPKVGIDLWNSDLRAGTAVPLRAEAELADSFSSSPFRKRSQDRDALVAAARAVDRQFLAARFRSFDHAHPNTAGHRLIAALVCQHAPAVWACDCDAIRRAEWKRGKVSAGL